MEPKFKLLCVYDPGAVLKAWPFVSSGVERILDNAGTDTSMDKILNDLLNGSLLLWMMFIDGAYSGFATTRITSTPPYGKSLWIVHTYKKMKVPTEWMMKALEEIERFAQSQGCTNIRFYALPKPWQEKMKAAGYEPGYVEFVKEIWNEDLHKDRNES